MKNSGIIRFNINKVRKELFEMLSETDGIISNSKRHITINKRNLGYVAGGIAAGAIGHKYLPGYIKKKKKQYINKHIQQYVKKHKEQIASDYIRKHKIETLKKLVSS